jgi:hypothetical protein
MPDGPAASLDKEWPLIRVQALHCAECSALFAPRLLAAIDGVLRLAASWAAEPDAPSTSLRAEGAVRALHACAAEVERAVALECFADGEIAAGQVIHPISAGDPWDDLVAKVAAHRAERGGEPVKLNGTAKATLKDHGVSQAEWARRHFADGRWHGDTCGCPDDRCIGYHHDAGEDCGCLHTLLRRAAEEDRLAAADVPVTAVTAAIGSTSRAGDADAWAEAGGKTVGALLARRDLLTAILAAAARVIREDERKRLFAELGNDHFVIFKPDGWTTEHSVECRLSGRMSECKWHEAVKRIADGYDPELAGRWRIADIDSEGLPSLERVEGTGA